ncbi:MAG: hypothetical protein ACRD2U_17480 [Terriglobales bacterium]
MDSFWNLVKHKGPDGLRCIRELVETEREDKYFLFDAASILTTFDKTGDSDKTILDGLVGTDLRDVDPSGYIYVALQLSHRGDDIGPAANKYLHAPDVTTYLPAHGGYELNRTRGAILLYGSLPPGLVDKYLDPEIRASEPEVRDTAAVILSLNMTEDSFRAIASLGARSGLSKAALDQVESVRKYQAVPVSRPSKYTRQQMLEKISRLPEVEDGINDAENRALDNSIYAEINDGDLNALREGRERMIQGVSNESVEGYLEMSRILLNLINVLDLYRTYRIH